MAKKILITGASGLVGSRLTEILVQHGHSVSHLGRSRRSGTIPSFVWDVDKGTVDPQALADVDSIIHLAGAGVAEKRWTTDRKKEILDSRIHSTALLYRELMQGNHHITTLVAASAIGFYGFGKGAETFTESSPAGTDFLAQVVKEWETETEKFSSVPLRLVKLRIGIVLSPEGGALKPMVTPVRWGFGSPLGDGKQYLSWVHMDDLCNMFLHAIQNDEVKGVYNAVGPQPVTNQELTRQIAKVLNKPLWLPPVPSLILRIMLGEMADMVINGSKVSSEKLSQTGFRYAWPVLEDALKNLLGK